MQTGMPDWGYGLHLIDPVKTGSSHSGMVLIPTIFPLRPSKRREPTCVYWHVDQHSMGHTFILLFCVFSTLHFFGEAGDFHWEMTQSVLNTIKRVSLQPQ